MSYRVLWNPDAEEQYAAIEAQSEDREELRLSVRSIDRWLAFEPMNFGESREDNVRVGIDGQLVVFFEVMEDVRTVIVSRVWQPRR